jgi:hypothetical protein
VQTVAFSGMLCQMNVNGMSQRQPEPILPAEGVTFWQARSYRVSCGWLEAEPGAAWERATPAALYKPAGKNRDPEAGPHLTFLYLAGLLRDDSDLFEKAMTLFAKEVGLLGAIHETFLFPPVLPTDKLWAAPEAVVEADGALRRLDPETEGVELLLELLDKRGFFSAGRLPYVDEELNRERARSRVALPSEVTLLSKHPTGPWRDPHQLDVEPVGWESAKESYGALLVLDEATSTRVSVLSTREPVADWKRHLLDFPVGEYRPEDRSLRRSLNSCLTGVSPYSPEDEEEYRRGWRCSSLLEAMHLMLWLDLTGGRSVRECGLRDCSNYFRVGSQSGTLYCSGKHASLASTRMNRGQEP